MLFVEGEPPSQFHVVLDGWIRPFRQTGDGRESVIALFARGESFAEAVMFLGGKFPVSATGGRRSPAAGDRGGTVPPRSRPTTSSTSG
jgi:CRP-like cAMP-binding protein